MEQLQQSHILHGTFPAQGHVNPTLQFAKRLIRIGVRATFTTTVSPCRRMTNNLTPDDALSFASFSDGFDDGFKSKQIDLANNMSGIKRRGFETLTELIKAGQNQGGQTFTCLVYTQLVPWSLLWLQPAFVFDVYYYYFYGYGQLIEEKAKDYQLLGLPPLTRCDLPSFMERTNSINTYSFMLSSFKEQMEAIVEETNPRFLVNTFEALEPETLRAINKFNIISFGVRTVSSISVFGRKRPVRRRFFTWNANLTGLEYRIASSKAKEQQRYGLEMITKIKRIRLYVVLTHPWL